MKKVGYTCDRCGKEIRKNVDCTDYDIVLGKCTKKIHCDLCVSCFYELKTLIEKFVTEDQTKRILSRLKENNRL